MTSSETSPDRPRIVIYGATSTSGRRVAEALRSSDYQLVLSGRNEAALVALRQDLIDASLGESMPRISVVRAQGDQELRAAFTGATIVINCAAPIVALGQSIVAAALAASAHYLDTAGDPAFMRGLYERCESVARHRARIVCSGLSATVALADWASTVAARQLGVPSDCDITIGLAFDEPALSRGAAARLALRLGGQSWEWRHDRWDDVELGARSELIDFGSDHGGQRTAWTAPGGEIITIPRHLAARSVQTLVSPSRSHGLGRFTQSLAWFAPLVGIAKIPLPPEVLHALPSDDDSLSRTQFALLATVRSGPQTASIRLAGGDPYLVTGAVVATVVAQLVAEAPLAVGAIAPSQLVDAEFALARVCTASDVTITRAH